jgi:hypothetical protein
MRVPRRPFPTPLLAAASWALATAAALALLSSAAPPARARTITLTFQPHGTFFSTETRQPAAIDPQVFVESAGAAAGIGPQQIPHSAGYRPARLSDPPDTLLYGADGVPLNLTLRRWLDARGTAAIDPIDDGGDRIAAFFIGLIPHGTYSLFEVTFRSGGNVFTPLDGRGASTAFVADARGRARVTVSAPRVLTRSNAVLLSYHSDGQTHGRSRGMPGINVHDQLIARVP